MHTTYHKVQYYETDMMQIVHHSNYIRWFEEARMDMMDSSGFPYAKLEEQKILIPVLSVSAEYKKPCRFGETVLIETGIDRYTGVKLCFEYTIWDEKRTEIRVTGNSSHCFVNSEFNPVALKKYCTKLDEILKASLQ